MTRPIASQAAEDLYSSLGPWAEDDPKTPLPSVNLIANGDFEYDVTGQPVAGWEKLIGSTNMVAQVVNFVPQSHGVKTTSIGSGAAEAWRYRTTEFMPVEENTSYTLTHGNFQISSNLVTGYRTQIEWYDEDEVLLSTASAASVTNGGNGVLLMRTHVAVSPAGAAFAKIVLDHGAANIDNYYVDSFMFCPTEVHPGLTTASANYRDGDSAGTGMQNWTWTGTVGNSISSTPDSTYPLLTLCEAIAGRLQGIEDIIRDDPVTDDPGWSVVMDVDRAPSDWLAWLAQFAGVRLDPSLSDADQRIRIKSTDGFKRGTPSAIAGAVQPLLTGTRSVQIAERYGTAYRLNVVTLAAETPDLAKVQAAALAQKPAGLVMVVAALTGLDWTSFTLSHTDYDDVFATFVNYNEVLSNPMK